MLKNISRARIAGAWCAIVIVLGAYGVVSGAAMTVSAAALWLLACVGPPAVMLFVWRGAPPPTVAEVLHTVDIGSKEARS
ncbi:MAG: hypothetical protein LAO77_19325 [Acidobacteriia bacterium]|nr:hypothetical protein [Terriglobia bacterium]